VSFRANMGCGMVSLCHLAVGRGLSSTAAPRPKARQSRKLGDGRGTHGRGLRCRQKQPAVAIRPERRLPDWKRHKLSGSTETYCMGQRESVLSTGQGRNCLQTLHKTWLLVCMHGALGQYMHRGMVWWCAREYVTNQALARLLIVVVGSLLQAAAGAGLAAARGDGRKGLCTPYPCRDTH
jgi:hypothetical protein